MQQPRKIDLCFGSIMFFSYLLYSLFLFWQCRYQRKERRKNNVVFLAGGQYLSAAGFANGQFGSSTLRIAIHILYSGNVSATHSILQLLFIYITYTHMQYFTFFLQFKHSIY